MEGVDREVRQFGVEAPGGVKHVRLRVRTIHEKGN